MSLLIQGMIFLSMSLTGILLGLWLDFYRVLHIKSTRWLRPVLDIMFWLVVTAFVIGALFLVNNLELRLYVFISLGLGLAIYLRLFSKWVMRFYQFLFRVLIKGFQLLLTALRPLWFPVRFIASIVDNFSLIIVTLVAFCYSFLQNKYFQQEKPPSA
ncbi:MAG: spore cortex biosynthesis protein YabQ [Firmicutes bacterium]|nr:spore cortex biosynthesis protein YabQ [Bacillota bacterium]